MDCKIKAAGKNSGIFHEGGTKSSKSFLTVFIRSVFPLSPSFPAGGGIWGPMEKKPGGVGKKKGSEKKLLGEISSSPQKETQARKNVEYYINIVFPFCTDFFGRKRINRKKKREMVPVWALFFLLGKKKSRNQLTRIFFFLVSAMLLQVTLRRPSVSWWKLLQCTGFRWRPSLHLRLVYSFSSDYHILIGAKKF
ncbi:CDN_1a_G0024190.mRNA.1.CDS.1 [Saccharomyces cerevisiae]|nr:BJ4_G0001430.mRNA.1.CDS.1 [Saccharomyces cerevisiae]CAI4440044.1 BAP_1a_G0024300.mRNA.1.CDS.1 [Saccharomyces cerevisiae]CAI4531127.1 CQI_4a_G0024190.mRNA.1.CDS.1 [Saccharomyces cerevisiae]CAI4533047.1 CCC_1a_G0024290.mRNA.1.CDS.1 [Saccharomyces cerevisiae]CAI4536170.1 CDN_1a_G0024190.mRNA.1.CDS.1 [Saccharomyces cerevisiae]